MAEKAKKFKWNENLTEQAVKLYEDGSKSKEDVEAIATAIGTSFKSVVGKLVSKGIYQIPEKPTKQAKKDDGPSKKAYLDAIAEKINVEGLEGATKTGLAGVAKALGMSVAKA